MTDTPVLHTRHLVLRRPERADFPAHLAFARSERARPMGGPWDADRAWLTFLAGIGMWAACGHGYFTVLRGEVRVGRVGVVASAEADEPELAWTIYAGHEGRGYAREAAAAVRADYRARISDRPLVSRIDRRNPRSITVATGLGARLESREAARLIYRHPLPEAA